MSTDQLKVFKNLVFNVPFSQESRCYRLLQLPNGILTLLISDPSEDLASCSVCVSAGSHLDPPDIPGLAHLTEHMLFVSSKEYPKVDYCKQLVTKLGGSLNANTTGEQTTFFFEIPTNATLIDSLTNRSSSSFNKQLNSDFSFKGQAFDHLVNLVASFFKEPLFNLSFAEKEIHAIENEHLQNISRLNKKLYHGLRLLSDSNHPFSKFCTGNFHTLHNLPKANKINLRKALVDYFRNHYLAKNMTLVLRGPESLNMLQKLAVANFSTIPSGVKSSKVDVFLNKANGNSSTLLTPASSILSANEIMNSTSSKWSNRYKVEAFHKKNANKAILIEDNTPSSVLRVYFPISCELKNSIDPSEFSVFVNLWCQLMGDESDGSMISNLLKLGYLSSCSSDLIEIATDSLLLNFQLKLSSLGLKNVDTILQTVLEYSSTLFNSTNPKAMKNLAKYISQNNTIEIFNFMNKDVPSSPFKETCELSQLLHCDFKALPMKWLIKGSPIFDFDSFGYCGGYEESANAKRWWVEKAHKLSGFVQQIVMPNNIIIAYIGQTNVLHSSHSLSNIASSSFHKDEFFLYDYKIVGIEMNWLKSLPTSSFHLSLPRPNHFLTGLSLTQSEELQALIKVSKQAAESSLNLISKNMSTYSPPKLISHGNGYQFFIKKESNNMYKNKAFFTMDLVNTRINSSVEGSLILEIWCNIVKDELSATLYPALLLGYTWTIIPTLQGDARITINVSGPIDKLFSILDLIVTEFQNTSQNCKDLITTAMFRNSRVKLRSKYEGLADENSLFMAILGLYVALEENTWQINDRYDCLENLTLEIFQDYIAHFLSNELSYTCFIHGDIKETSFDTDVFPVLSKLSGCGSCHGYIKPSTIYLPKGCNYKIIQNNSDKDPTNSISFFIQIGQRYGIYTRTLTKFLIYIMSTELPYKLRSEAQLGYAVMVGMRILRDTVGIHISIMSGDYAPEYLESEIEKMLYSWWFETFGDGSSLTESQFKSRYVNSFIQFYNNSNQKLDAVGGPSSLFANSISSDTGSDSKLLKEHESYWFQISSSTYAFSKDSSGEDMIDISLIKNLKLSDFNDFYQTKILSPDTSSKISIMIKTAMLSEDAHTEIMAMKLEGFLRLHGLNISQDEVKKIMQRCGGSNNKMIKEFVKYFQSQGNLVKFMRIMSKEVLGALTGSIKGLGSGSTAASLSKYDATECQIKEPMEITDLREFQNHTGFYRPVVSLEKKLAQLVQ